MSATTTFSAWIEQAQIPDARLTPEQRVLLQAAFHFRQRQGDDYYSTRLLGHFLLHAGSGLKVAQLARLVGISRPTASGQQGLSSKEVIQQAHHRMDGRPHAKLLPRYAGAIAQYLLNHPAAARADLLDFIDRTFGVRVSRIALYKFLKKYGLDAVSSTPPATALPAMSLPAAVASPVATPPATASPPTTPATPPLPLAASAPPFCPDGRATPALS